MRVRVVATLRPEWGAGRGAETAVGVSEEHRHGVLVVVSGRNVWAPIAVNVGDRDLGGRLAHVDLAVRLGAEPAGAVTEMRLQACPGRQDQVRVAIRVAVGNGDAVGGDRQRGPARGNERNPPSRGRFGAAQGDGSRQT